APGALPRRARPDDDAAAERRPGGVAPVLPPPARARRVARAPRALDGNIAGLPRRRGRGRDPGSRRIDPVREVAFRTRMALGDLWNRTLVYFGIAEEDEWDDDAAVEEELERSYEERRANVRRLSPRRSEREPDDWTEATAESAKPRARLRRVDAPPPP